MSSANRRRAVVVDRDRVAPLDLDRRRRRHGRRRCPSRPARCPRGPRSRADADTVRTVPASSAVSGITLVVVPARILATVTTAGSKTSTRRVTIDWSARTISAAIGMGSPAWCGMEAWPPLPRTTISNSSADASRAWPLLATMPDGIDGVWWMANAIDTGSAPFDCGVEQALVEHDLGAALALLAGLEHEHDPAPEVPAACRQHGGRAGEHRRVGVVPARVHGAVDGAGEVEAGVLGHRERVHVPSEQDGGAGLVAVEHRHDRGRGRAGVDGQRQAVEGLEHGGLGPWELEPELGVHVDPAAQRHHVVELCARLVEQAVEHVGHGSGRYFPRRCEARAPRRDEGSPTRQLGVIAAATAWTPPSTWTISPVVAGNQPLSRATTALAAGSGSSTSQVSGARLGPGLLDLVEPGDAPGGDGAQRSGGHEVDPDPVGTEVPRQVPRRRLERGLRHAHPVVGRPGLAGVEVQADDGRARAHQRPHRPGEGRQRVRRDLHRGGHVLPARRRAARPPGRGTTPGRSPRRARGRRRGRGSHPWSRRRGAGARDRSRPARARRAGRAAAWPLVR